MRVCERTASLSAALTLAPGCREVGDETLGATFAGVMVQLGLLTLGSGVPTIIYGMGSNQMAGYSLLQLTNPFWTLAEAMDGGIQQNGFEIVLFLVPAMAAVVFLFNLPGVARELQHVRIAAPARVIADEAATY